AEKIALGVDHAERRGVRQMLSSDRERRADALLEKVLVHFDPLRREDADVDLRARVVKAHAEQPLAMVLDLHQFAVARLGGEEEDENEEEEKLCHNFTHI